MVLIENLRLCLTRSQPKLMRSHPLGETGPAARFMMCFKLWAYGPFFFCRSEAEQEACLQETESAFQMGGAVMGSLMGSIIAT